MISAESKELLQDFEKRMRFVNLIKYWLQRSKPTEIRELLHNDDDKTDNLILMVMVFIMDSTLRYGERCTKQDITAFLRELADVYDYEPESAKLLADYIAEPISLRFQLMNTKKSLHRSGIPLRTKTSSSVISVLSYQQSCKRLQMLRSKKMKI